MARTQQAGQIWPSDRATDENAPILGAKILIIANHRSQVRETESKNKMETTRHEHCNQLKQYME